MDVRHICGTAPHTSLPRNCSIEGAEMAVQVRSPWAALVCTRCCQETGGYTECSCFQLHIAQRVSRTRHVVQLPAVYTYSTTIQ